MNILFIPPPYLDLYKDIESELISMGHNVTTVVKGCISGHPFYKKQNPLKHLYLKLKWNINKTSTKYWEKELKKDIYNKRYDLLFVIQGLSFDPILLDHLRSFNPNIKTSLYIWDTNRMYDFFRNIDYFDKVYSFDYLDVDKFGGGKAEFLPFFWPKSILELKDVNTEYEISSVGTDHDGRFFIFKKVIEQCKQRGKSFFIKIVNNKLPINHSIKSRLLFKIYSLLNIQKDFCEYHLLLNGSVKYDFVQTDYFSTQELNKIMAESKSILDTDNVLQHGTTPRLIWALALNKHVFTTNTNIVNLPFYNKDYIHIIDRDNPTIDFSVINTAVHSSDKVEYLRIDNWVNNFL